METVGFALLIVIGVVLLLVAAGMGKKKLNKKSIEQRQRELFEDYDKKMNEFRR